MPRGDKSKYTEKQKRQAEKIAEGYERRGVGEKTAESRAWATVNAMTGGGKLSGSGRGKTIDKAPAKKGDDSEAKRRPRVRLTSEPRRPGKRLPHALGTAERQTWNRQTCDVSPTPAGRCHGAMSVWWQGVVGVSV